MCNDVNMYCVLTQRVRSVRFIAQIAATTWTRYTPLNCSVQQLLYKAMQYSSIQWNTIQCNADIDITAHKKNKISHLRLRNVLFFLFLSFSLRLITIKLLVYYYLFSLYLYLYISLDLYLISTWSVLYYTNS